MQRSTRPAIVLALALVGGTASGAYAASEAPAPNDAYAASRALAAEDRRAARVPHAAWSVRPNAQEPQQAVQEPPPEAEEPLAPDTALAQQLEPVTDTRAAQDEAIRNQLQAVFDRVPDLAGVDVTVDAGVVRLEGAVVRSENRTRAGELASGLEGVLFLDNRIHESTSLEEQLRPTWARLRTLGLATVAKLPLLAVGLLIMWAATVLSSWLARWRGFRFLQPENPLLQNLAQRILSAVVIVVALLVVLDMLNAGTLVGAIVGTAGLAGLAVGFAFKDIVENYLAGILLALRQPFQKNDHIRVEGFEGKVVRLTARETILMTLDGNHVRLPNALIFRNPMLNFTRNPLRRFQFDVDIGPSDDYAHARTTGLAVLAEMEGILTDPAPEILLQHLGASTVTLSVLAWVDQRRVDLGRVRSEAIRRVKEGLETAGVTLPSPEYLVRWSGEAPQPPPASAGERAAPYAPAPAGPDDADLSVNRTLDRQIEEERRASAEPDLLDPAPEPIDPAGEDA